MNDEEIAELVEQTLQLKELHFVDMAVSTLTIEAIASSAPQVSRLSIVGSQYLSDVAVRCVTGVCMNLTELTLQRCPLLSDGAFSRCIMLHQLRKLDIADCSWLLDGTLLKSFQVLF